MPNYNVNDEQTSATSTKMLNDFATLQEMLTKVRAEVESLVANGYDTPEARNRFQPFFEEFSRGFESVNTGMEGIGNYVRAVGESFAETDKSLGSQLA